MDESSLSTVEKDDLEEGMERLFDPTKHITHFSTCAYADDFRRNK